LNGDMGDSVRVAYLMCRAADGLEDSWPRGSADGVRERFDRFLAALAGDDASAARLGADAAAIAGSRADLDLVANLERVLRVHRALPPACRAAVHDGVETLARGMARFAARAAARPPGAAYVDTEEELREYCFVVAGCVGVMLTRLLATTHGLPDDETQRERLLLAPTVGDALQLTNILLDWPSDVRRGRCYLPATWLAEAGLRPVDLVGRETPGVRGLADRLESMAREALLGVPDYLDRVPRRAVRYRLFCLLPTQWALASLRHARRDPTFPWGPARPRMPRAQLWSRALSSLLAVGHPGAVRALFEPTPLR
jgi:farnesyl-diphosphate farnesyltransferase